MASSFVSLPVLDLSDFTSLDASRQAAFVESLRYACHVPGFFYIKNHGVPQSLCDEAFRVTKNFFALPLEEKQKIENIHSPHFRGYAAVGKEKTKGLTDRREQVDFGNEYPPEPDYKNKPPYVRLHGPNQWPDDSVCPGFRSTLTAFMDEAQKLSITLMEAMALSLGLPRSYFESTFSGNPHVRMKVINYPPITDPEEVKAMPFGVGEHKDYGFLSLLLQDEVGGLQAMNGAGEWVDAVPIPGTFVVNIGEMLEICTGGYYIATIHRAVNHSPEKGRISIPYFFNPRLDAEIVPIKLPDTLEFERALKILPSDPNNVLHSVYGVNAFKGLSRSHLDVTRRHYPELSQ